MPFPVRNTRSNTAAVRGAWFFVAAVGILQVSVFLVSFHHQFRTPPSAFTVLTLPPVFFVWYFTILGLASLIVFYGGSALFIWQRKPEAIHIQVAFLLVALGSAPVEVYLPIDPAVLVGQYPILWFTGPLLALLGWGGFSLFVFMFPDGRIVGRWAKLSAVFAVFTFSLWAVSPPGSLIDPYVWPPLLFAGLNLVIWGSVFYYQIHRYRKVSSPSQRQQTKWVLYGFLGLVLVNFLRLLFEFQLPGLVENQSAFTWFQLYSGVAQLSLALLPVTLVFAIFRYRLWDIDLIINRTLVYGALTAAVVGIYILAVGVLSTLFRTEGAIVSFLATGVVALLVQPLREWLQRRVNRMTFGERDEPYKVLKRLSERLDLAVETEQILPTIVETVVHALKLPYAAITLRKGGAYHTAAAYPGAAGPPSEGLETIPLVYHAEPVGQLVLAPRAPGEYFSPGDRQLLETIARQASIAAYNLRLANALQISREQLVTAREEERRRLRRDLHDGLGPLLATISVGMDAISNVASDPSATRRIARQVKGQAQAALEDIRRIAYDLRPPALDELGLVGALKQHIEATSHLEGLYIEFDPQEPLPRLPAAVEVAAYRIALEALTNVRRHAGADACLVRLSAGRELCLEILDNGQGLPDTPAVGVGLIGMRERAAELGGSFAIQKRNEGGTAVTARLPLKPEIG